MTTTAAIVERWRELLSSYNTLTCALDRELQAGHGIGLSEFEVLDRLADRCAAAPDPDCPMTDLAADMYLSQSALSRAVARLEKEGLLRRAMCDHDRRSIFVRLTGAGRERHAAALPTHRAVLAEHLR